MFDPESVERKVLLDRFNWDVQFPCVAAADYDKLLELYRRRVEVTDALIMTECEKVVRQIMEPLLEEAKSEAASTPEGLSKSIGDWKMERTFNPKED